MSVSPAYREFILEQLSRLLPITPRNMFGAIGFYSEGAFFAVVDDDTLYFKVDDSTRPAYEALGSESFTPNSGDPPSKGYYTVPGEVLEDPYELRKWALAAVSVARAKAKKRSVPKPNAPARKTVTEQPAPSTAKEASSKAQKKHAAKPAKKSPRRRG